MKVLHVVQRFHPDVGGAETHVRALAREQSARGHDVTVVTSGGPREETFEGYRVVRLAARQRRREYLWPPWSVMPGLEAVLASEEPDVYHAHSYRFHTIEAAASASRATRRPLVVTAHGFYPPENALVALARWRYDRARGRGALRQAARCVAVTRHEIGLYAKLGVSRDRIDVVPNGVATSAFEPGDGASFRKTHDLGDGRLVVFLARLAHDKGLMDLMRAAKIVPEATFAVCGQDAGARAAAERLAPANVRFLGPIPEPRDAYAAADVFCLPSHYEAFGLVLLEAMAQGRAVIATSAGGMPEVVANAGAIVPPRHPDALAGALRRLLGDRAARARLGEIGRERARSFLWPDVVTRLEETYARALSR